MNSLVIPFSWKHCNLSKEVCRQILFSALNDNRQSLHLFFFPSPSEPSHILCGLWKITTISSQNASECTKYHAQIPVYWGHLRRTTEPLTVINKATFLFKTTWKWNLSENQELQRSCSQHRAWSTVHQTNKKGLLRKQSPLKSLQFIMQGGGTWDGRNHTGYIKSDT